MDFLQMKFTVFIAIIVGCYALISKYFHGNKFDTLTKNIEDLTANDEIIKEKLKEGNDDFNAFKFDINLLKRDQSTLESKLDFVEKQIEVNEKRIDVLENKINSNSGRYH
ncbi:MAG: hypothetical protein EHM25_00790 [Nitrosopumilales archaeon]|nr:MAG: hypothetical protein EHM25_12440 [Nitrosopumilales archaeon]RPJ31571.1 MAG: hypothetical protein EHM25_02740 [Nitrosopumilales archaeon]RPJ32468.1 MAG: hypothetical protein EHM25_00790 [Nitrosopumilales archaeon]